MSPPHGQSAWCVAAALSVALLAAAPAAAQAQPEVRAGGRRPTAITAGGGTSMGAYQAGFLYVTMRALVGEDAHGAGAPPVMTGASAGSVNVVLAALSACLQDEDEPERSVFWDAWIPVGIEGLLAPNDPNGLPGALSWQPIDAAIARLEALWTEGRRWRPSGCRARIGFTLTRLAGRPMPLVTGRDPPDADGATRWQDADGEAYVDRLIEKLVLEVRAGPGEAPSFHNLTLADLEAVRDPRVLVVLGDVATVDAPVPRPHVYQALRGGVALPLIFSPVALAYRERLADGRLGPIAETLVFDGGMLDNMPLRFAEQLAAWRPASAQDGDARFLFLSAKLVPWEPNDPPDLDIEGVLDLVTDFTPHFLRHVRNTGVTEFLEALEGRANLVAPVRRMPLASEHFNTFSGFLERDFRRADFYLGMVDAWRYLHAAGFGFGDGVSAPSPFRSLAFDCYRHALLGPEPPDPAAVPACRGLAARPDDANLVKLLAALLDVRARLMASADAREVDASTRFLEALHAHGYAYRDLRLDGAPVSAEPIAVRRAVRGVLERVVARLQQHAGGALDATAVDLAGGSLANAFLYRPPRRAIGLAANLSGGVDLTYLQGFGYSPHQLFVRARVERPREHQLADLAQVRAAGFAGGVCDFEAPGGLDNCPFTLDFGLAAGWARELVQGSLFQASAGLGWRLTTRRAIDDGLRGVSWSHGPELSGTLSLWQRLFAQVDLAWAFEHVDDAYRHPALVDISRRADLLGLPLELTLAVGWRWLW